MGCVSTCRRQQNKRSFTMHMSALVPRDGPGPGVWKSQWAHVPGPQRFVWNVGETHVKCQLAPVVVCKVSVRPVHGCASHRHRCTVVIIRTFMAINTCTSPRSHISTSIIPSPTIMGADPASTSFFGRYIAMHLRKEELFFDCFFLGVTSSIFDFLQLG